MTRRIEDRFHDEMLRLYKSAGEETGYWARRFLQQVKRVGGLPAAKKWLRPTTKPPDGLWKLAELGRLDLSLETLVCRPQWSALFTPEERQVAESRLEQVASLCCAEEVADATGFFEGAIRQITVNAYERNQAARSKCIKHHGLNCSVCDFNFESFYGPLAKHFIHVHHIKPLRGIGAKYEVDPIADLRPVCPNCHAVIHLGGKTRSIEEVKVLVKKARARRRSLQ
jgi:5-methylcytosine-specific restriction protein A